MGNLGPQLYIKKHLTDQRHHMSNDVGLRLLGNIAKQLEYAEVLRLDSKFSLCICILPNELPYQGPMNLPPALTLRGSKATRAEVQAQHKSQNNFGGISWSLWFSYPIPSLMVYSFYSFPWCQGQPFELHAWSVKLRMKRLAMSCLCQRQRRKQRARRKPKVPRSDSLSPFGDLEVTSDRSCSDNFSIHGVAFPQSGLPSGILLKACGW